MEPYDDVKVVSLGKEITEGEGSEIARVEGERHKASIVIWGWYGLTNEIVPLSVRFEVVESYLPELDLESRFEGQVRTISVADLNSFAMQTRVSEEMTCLSFITVGIARSLAKDWSNAISAFNDALDYVANFESKDFLIHLYF